MKLLMRVLTCFQCAHISSKSTPLFTVEKRKPNTITLKQGLLIAMLGFSSLSFTGTASATLIDSINSLNPGDLYRVLFVTSTTIDATSPVIGVYDSHVAGNASVGLVTSALGLSWQALVSTPTDNVQTHTGIHNSDHAPVTFFNTVGDIVALSGSDLWDGNLLSPIYFTEFGNVHIGLSWTGFGPDGPTLAPLGSGPDPDDLATIGYTQHVDQRWAELGLLRIDQQQSIYAVSQVAAAPAAIGVPEPGTYIMLMLGIAGLSLSRYKNRS